MANTQTGLTVINKSTGTTVGTYTTMEEAMTVTTAGGDFEWVFNGAVTGSTHFKTQANSITISGSGTFTNSTQFWFGYDSSSATQVTIAQGANITFDVGTSLNFRYNSTTQVASTMTINDAVFKVADTQAPGNGLISVIGYGTTAATDADGNVLYGFKQADGTYVANYDQYNVLTVFDKWQQYEDNVAFSLTNYGYAKLDGLSLKSDGAEFTNVKVENSKLEIGGNGLVFNYAGDTIWISGDSEVSFHTLNFAAKGTIDITGLDSEVKVTDKITNVANGSLVISLTSADLESVAAGSKKALFENTTTGTDTLATTIKVDGTALTANSDGSYTSGDYTFAWAAAGTDDVANDLVLTGPTPPYKVDGVIYATEAETLAAIAASTASQVAVNVMNGDLTLKSESGKNLKLVVSANAVEDALKDMPTSSTVTVSEGFTGRISYSHVGIDDGLAVGGTVTSTTPETSLYKLIIDGVDTTAGQDTDYIYVYNSGYLEVKNGGKLGGGDGVYMQGNVKVTGEGSTITGALLSLYGCKTGISVQCDVMDGGKIQFTDDSQTMNLGHASTAGRGGVLNIAGGIVDVNMNINVNADRGSLKISNSTANDKTYFGMLKAISLNLANSTLTAPVTISVNSSDFVKLTSDYNIIELTSSTAALDTSKISVTLDGAAYTLGTEFSDAKGSKYVIELADGSGDTAVNDLVVSIVYKAPDFSDSDIFAANLSGTTGVVVNDASNKLNAYEGDGTPGGVVWGLGDWEMLDVADVNGDGLDDILISYQHSNDVTGVAALINQDNGSYGMTHTDIRGWANSDWEYLGAADINGDGIEDILTIETDALATGRDKNINAWVLDANGQYTADMRICGKNSDWEIKGFADITGDNKADGILRFNDIVAFWEHNGNNDSVLKEIGKLATNWEIGGCDDFTGDGKADLLIGTADNQFKLWTDLGAGKHTEIDLGTMSDSNFDFEGIGDFNGDGKADILWQAADGSSLCWSEAASGKLNTMNTIA